ncbi:MAG: sulfurtransferase TusA family protein [Pseudomonadota bacterium]|nr:sulfurtransferase TusA family protein [Pseudomonadota bacterium]
MKCPWPALRATRAMRETDAIVIEADDPIAGAELEALARHNGWDFAALGQDRYRLARRTGPAQPREL